MRYVFISALALVLFLAFPPVTVASPLSQYRGVTLGDGLDVVVKQLRLATSDVKIIHDRPVLVQEVTWRPQPTMNGSPQPESISDIVLTFQAGRLARIAVNYDRARTQGMTDVDLHEAMSPLYGVSMLIPTATERATGSAERQTIGRWEEAETVMLLWREQFPNRVGLTITSSVTEPALLKAIADAVQLTTSEGPERDRAQRAAEVAAVQARDEKIRLENKAKFKPK